MEKESPEIYSALWATLKLPISTNS